MAAWSPAAGTPLLRLSHRLPLLYCVHRMFISQTEGELKVTQVLRENFPRATAIKVTDISEGPCLSRARLTTLGAPCWALSPGHQGKNGAQRRHEESEQTGGCGAMYEIKIESEEFKEKRTVQQHQMVNQALKEEIKGMHGLRIFTSVPKH
ncbi:bolA-like protein 3 isoform X2 [Heterocephalus glaber]|uniref:BolA-like protein 3 isoform X2 n=1 Tax=Heterocephalus glaber TaxID=10181 RepID=A0AAX6P6Y8_HETGA|nr:bolA-like protein 3 isoform X2 [Heterocephalus glaber]